MSVKKNINLPGWPKRFFEWYCGSAVAEDLAGDMEELFFQNLQKMSPFKARLKYSLQALTLIFSYGLNNRKRKYKLQHGSSSYHSFAMYRSYSKIAFRSLAKQKTFSIINIICLSVGMSIGLLALAVYVDVTTVDDFQANAVRIYRITTEVDDANEKIMYASSSAPLADRLRQDASGIEEVVQIAKDFNPEIIQSPNTAIPLQGYYAEQNFFSVFSFELIEGNPQQALAKPFSVVITESAAKKLFRDISVIGKVLEVKDKGYFEVTGVIKDHPRSHFYFEIIASYNTIAALEQQQKIQPTLQDWGPVTDHYIYVMLNNDKAPEDVEKVAKRIMSDQFKGEKLMVTPIMQGLRDIPMSELSNEIGLSWGYMSLLIFFFLAILVLLPACFNYTHIAIAHALKRAKEIGLRKVSGGESRHIFFQMVMETIILSVISLVGAVAIFMVIRAAFLDMVVQGSLSFDLEITPFTFTIFLLFAIFTGFLAGAFPAAYFSKLNPIETLRNTSQSGKLSKISIRKGLIVAQFTLSMVFILGVAIVAKQYRYAINYDLGFQKENILDIPLKGVDEKILRTELEKMTDVTSVSMSSSIPGNWTASSIMVRPPEKVDSLEVYQMFVDHNYIQNLEIELVAGSNFPLNSNGKEEYIVVNETFVKKAGLSNPFDALGKSFIVDEGKELSVIGVVKDFNFMPLREAINSFFFRNDPSMFNFANVKLKSQDMQLTLSNIERSWNKISDQKFESRFLDDELDASLVSFKSMVKIFGFLGAIAITISCLGLLAVVISAAEGRLREMSLRKIFGASVTNLAFSLSKGFLKLIVIAVMIATPFTYILFDQFFLRMIFYRASIGFTEIAISVLLLFTLVLVIIGSQTLKVAKINPVDTLKYE